MSRCRVLTLTFLFLSSLLFQACYVTQDAQGQWWACDELQGENGPVTGCTPIDAPF
jgi:hypothetical protein